MINPYGLTDDQESNLREILLGSSVSRVDTELVSDITDGDENGGKPVSRDLEVENLLNDASDSVDESDITKSDKIVFFPLGKDYAKRVTPSFINDLFSGATHINEGKEESCISKKTFGNAGNYADFTTTEEGHRKRSESYNSPTTSEQAESPIMYQQNTYTDENGETQTCTEVAMKVDTSKFDFDFDSDSDESVINNVETLKALYTNIVKKKVGGFDRVTSIFVTNGRIIFNKNIYVNLVANSKQDAINFRDHLPLDLYEYVKQGMTGYFFDWSLLLRCRNLRSLVFDNFDFVSDVVAVDLNMSYVREDYFFTYLRQLKYLRMGEYEYTDKVPNTAEEKLQVKKQRIAAAREQSFLGRAKDYFSKSTFDYGRLKPTNWTDKLDNHFHMCFRDYLKNRGKKGLIRYTGGVIVRGLFAAASTLLNAGTHFVSDSVSYVSQYKPRVEEDPEWGIRYTTWNYTPNKRTSGEKPKYTSGEDVVNSIPNNSSYGEGERKAQRTYSGKGSYHSKGNKSGSNLKKDKFEVEDEDA